MDSCDKAKQTSTVPRTSNNSRLDPSLYMMASLADTSTTDAMEYSAATRSLVNSKTMLRRRIKANREESCPVIDELQMHSKHETIIPLTSSIYLPKDQVVYEKLKEEDDTNNTKKRGNLAGKDGNQEEIGQSTAETRSGDKIFSITTSVLLIVFVTSLVSIFCLCSINGNTLLVNAHYSANQQQQQQQPVAQAQVAKTNPQLRGSHQQQPSGDQISNGIRQTLGLSSIDRFDEGDQIRPPLLRQPTTVLPLTRRDQTADGGDSADSLQTADTSPDTYLSPEDREMFLKSQENHYEGKGNGESPISPLGGGSAGNGAELTAGSDGYESPSEGRWNGNGEGNPNQMPGPGGEQQLAGGNNNSPDGGPPDDSDLDEDEMPEREEKNLVPETRRTASGQHHHRNQHQNNGLSNAASYNHQRQRQFNRPMMDQQSGNGNYASGNGMANADADGDPNDDYGGGNDDAYFSRKSINGNGGGNNLNLAASYNQQNSRSPMGGRQVHQQALDAGPRGYNTNGEGPANDESPGFGPGPNEAYMVDRAESGRGDGGGGGGDDDGGAGAGPSDSDGSGYGAGAGADGGDDDEMPKYDRRSMNDLGNQQPSGLASSSYVNGGAPMSHYNQNQNSDGPSNPDPESDADEPSDSSEESAPSLSSSSPMDFKPRESPSLSLPIAGQQPQVAAIGSQSMATGANQITPKTSASAPAPQSALRPNTSYVSPLTQAPRPRGPQTVHQHQQQQQQPTLTTMRPPVAAQLPSHGLFNRQQTQNVNPHQVQQQNIWNQQQQQQQQYRATQAPYNPQNNPSHAGKYFIN